MNVRSLARSERGAGSILVLAVVMVVVVALIAAGVLAAGHVARQQAAAAADLAALAAAEAVRSGALEPCAIATRVAASNGAELRDCVVDGEAVEVQVRVPVRSGLAWLPDQLRRARAGPAP